MVFSNIFFIFGFLPVFLLAYYLVPYRLRNFLLVAGSLFFYAWGEPVYVILMIFSALFHYFMGLEMQELSHCPKKIRGNLVFIVVIDLFILGFFKYYGFFLDSIGGILGISISHPELSLPIGISFYTFKNLSYIFDICQKKIHAQKKLLPFMVYSTMFPHMTAGPIIRYADIEEQLTRRSVNIIKLGVGAEYFIKGLAAKILLADNLAGIYADLTSSGETLSFLGSWIAIFAYTMQIYFDFSGYSNMAIGLGKMLGFDFKKNFDYPYTSTSVSEFWRRWHISLGSWFRDYIYIPLGGNRVSPLKHVRNIFVVWALTGLWHGASWNFVLWGLYYGLLLLLEKFVLTDLLKKIPRPLANLYTMLAVMIGWVFFSQTDFSSMGNFLMALVGIGVSGFADTQALFALRSSLILFLIAIPASRPGLYQRYKLSMRRSPWKAAAVNMILLLLSVAFLVYNSYTPFLYLKF